jgi:hypothetical protein
MSQAWPRDERDDEPHGIAFARGFGHRQRAQTMGQRDRGNVMLWNRLLGGQRLSLGVMFR